MPIGKADEDTTKVVEGLYGDLREAGVDTVLDDRDERPGVKFADCELVGIPYRITVGPRGLKEGVVEVVDRASGETVQVPVADAVGHVAGLVAAARRG
ncbi:His/Gly/Thr/Pro-type tRNA ligase C-terminal domain-containing protein [Kitasatospora arboriphila]